MLWDGHSIQAELPWLFEGRLPDLNLGTAAGASCAPSLRDALMAVLAAQTSFSHVTDGRFKGGYITRHYGRPGERVHAVQLEMGWRLLHGRNARRAAVRRSTATGGAVAAGAARAAAGDARLAADDR